MSTTIKPRSAQVVIYQGDDLQRLGELRRAADIAQRMVDEFKQSGTARGGDAPSAEDEKAAYNAFVEEAAERAVVIEVHALGRKQFRSLMAAHPPRKVDGDEGKHVVHEDDAGYDVNMDDFPAPFLAASIAEPTFPTPADCERFLDDLADGDFDRVFSTAYWLNRAPGADPQSSKFSLGPPSLTAI